MDDGSVNHLKLTIDSDKGEAIFDFSGTSKEVYGNGMFQKRRQLLLSYIASAV